MSNKPQAPLSPTLRRILRRLIPQRAYRRYLGRHEDASQALWMRLAKSLPPESAILDIGAFHGEYALAARSVNRYARIFAFEPDPTNFATLLDSCRAADTQCENVAVSDCDGELRFACDSQMGHVVRDGGALIQAVSLDRWTNEHRVTPALIKIDVEGHEAAVFQGARGTLARHRPPILCEILTDEAGAAVMNLLPEGYRYFRIDEDRGPTEQRRIYRDNWRHKNWLFHCADLP